MRVLESVVAEVEGEGGCAHAMWLDVASEAAIDGFVERLTAEIGPIDVLINNAGISPTFDAALRLRSNDWDEIFSVNVRGPVLLALAVARTMLEAGKRGAIVNIASASGLVPVRNAMAYSVSKAALIHATRCLALELADAGIRVNAVAPGYLATDLTTGLRQSPAGSELECAVPLGRIGAVDEVVEAVLHLASRGSSYTTGACLTIDGGYTMQLRWP